MFGSRGGFLKWKDLWCIANDHYSIEAKLFDTISHDYFVALFSSFLNGSWAILLGYM